MPCDNPKEAAREGRTGVSYGHARPAGGLEKQGASPLPAARKMCVVLPRGALCNTTHAPAGILARGSFDPVASPDQGVPPVDPGQAGSLRRSLLNLPSTGGAPPGPPRQE